ncbi:hypothetical protein C8R45DRAFT_848437 [Mycena sanguinolenta]|nr:hypothetical protein C8R45DRAFT_848437 [Mycena sanguinolenta]
MQLKNNTRQTGSHGRLRDITNAPQSPKNTKRKKKRQDKAHKRPRIEPEENSVDPPNGESEPEGVAGDSDSSGNDQADKEDADALVKRAGRLYVLNYGLWIKGKAHIFDVKLDAKYDEKKRFDTAANKIQGQLREIEMILPKFMAGVTSQRPNTSTRLCRAAGPATFDCGAADLLDSEVCLRKFRDQIGWYVDKEGSGAYSTLDVPILHADWSGEYNIKTCFLGRSLMRLYVSLIRGPSAAALMLAEGGSDVVISIQRSENMECIYALDHIEPGAIAGSAVLAIWALSTDTFLRNQGDKTNIDYDALFDQYLEILLEGLRDKSQSILNVFREWDRVIFPNSESGYGGKIRSGPSDGGNQRALDALRAEKEVAMAVDSENRM